MKCRHARNVIAEHLAGEDQDLPEDLPAHLDDCPRCAGLWRDQTRIHWALTDAGTAPAPAAPADLAQRARRRLLEGERVPPAPLRVVLVYGALAAVVVIGAIAIYASRDRLPGGATPHIAQVDKQPVPHEEITPPGATAQVDEQSVPHEEIAPPGGTGNSLPVRPRPAEDAQVDEPLTSPRRMTPSFSRGPARPAGQGQPVPHEADRVDLLIIVCAPGAVMIEEEHSAPADWEADTPSAEWLPHTAFLAPQSADVVAQATLVESSASGPHLSASPSVSPIQGANLAALPVRSTDFVVQATAIESALQRPETETPAEPAETDVTVMPAPTILVDDAASGGADDEDEREHQILLCIDDGGGAVLLCGELGTGGRDLT